MKTWVISVATLIVAIGSGLGLWATWDLTQTSTYPAVGQAASELGSGLSADGLSDRSTTTATTPPVTNLDLSAGCTPGDAPVEGDPLTDWATIVVDPAHKLPADFVPPDLVDVSAAGFESTGDQVRQIVIPDLTALREGAEANGTPLAIASSYRSYDYQAGLFDHQVAEVGPEQALARTAQAGHSEHQLGTTVDVVDAGASDLTLGFADTPAGQWVAAHAHEYGFVLSYPQGGRESTCYEFEPWHLRYVGRDMAAKIHESGRTPRAWMLVEAREPT